MKGNRLTTIADIIIALTAYILFLINYFELRGVMLLETKLLNHMFLKSIDPIEDIDILRNVCDEENHYYPLVNYTFYGISQNCYDNISGTFKNKYPCPKNNKNYINIKGIKQRDLSIWRDKNICIKRMENKIMKNNKKKIYLTPVNTTCNESYISCGLINTDSDGKCNETKLQCKILCLYEKNEDNTTNNCPINFMTITNNIEPYKDESYIKKRLDLEYYLVYSNSKNLNNNPIPIDFKISEGEYPCLEVDRRSYNYSQFPLLKNYKYLNCNRGHYKENVSDLGYDTRYKPIDTYSKSLFFNDNSLGMEYGRLPNLQGKKIKWENDINNASYSIFYRDFYMDNENCGGYEKFHDNLKNLKKLQLIKLAWSLINLIALVVLIGCLKLVISINEYTYSGFFLLKILICYIFGAVYMYFIKGKILKKKYGYYSIIEKFVTYDNPCFDELTRITFNRYELKYDIHKTKQYYNQEFYTCVAYVVFTSILTGRFIEKTIARIKNKSRREIAVREIGKEKLQQILEKYRNRSRKKLN